VQTDDAPTGPFVREDLKSILYALLSGLHQNILRTAIVKEAAKIAIVLQNPLFLPLSALLQTH